MQHQGIGIVVTLHQLVSLVSLCRVMDFEMDCHGNQLCTNEPCPHGHVPVSVPVYCNANLV